MKQFIFIFAGLIFSQSLWADKYKDSFVEAAYQGNMMMVKTHINDLKGRGKEKHNEALRAAVSAPESAEKSVAKPTSRFKGSAIDVVKMLLASGANPNDQSFGRPSIFSTASNEEIKTILQTAGGQISTEDQLAVAIKAKNIADFEKVLSQAKPDELKLGNGIHSPTLIFEVYPIKNEGELIPYSQNLDPLIKMYVSLVNSKKTTDLFEVFEKNIESEFGRREKTEPLVKSFLAEDRWDLLEILVDHNAPVSALHDKLWALKWFEYRKNLMLSLIEKTPGISIDKNFERLNLFFNASNIQKFDAFAKRLPPIDADQLDKFFLESELSSEDKLKFIEGLSWKISASVMAGYISKKEVVISEPEFRRLERLTLKTGPPISPQIILNVYESGNLKTAQQILRLGADPEANHLGNTGLCIAIKRNNFQLAQLLLSYKASKTGACTPQSPTESQLIPYEKMEMTPQMQRLLFGQK